MPAVMPNTRWSAVDLTEHQKRAFEHASFLYAKDRITAIPGARLCLRAGVSPRDRLMMRPYIRRPAATQQPCQRQVGGSTLTIPRGGIIFQTTGGHQ